MKFINSTLIFLKHSVA